MNIKIEFQIWEVMDRGEVRRSCLKSFTSEEEAEQAICDSIEKRPDETNYWECFFVKKVFFGTRVKEPVYKLTIEDLNINEVIEISWGSSPHISAATALVVDRSNFGCYTEIAYFDEKDNLTGSRKLYWDQCKHEMGTAPELKVIGQGRQVQQLNWKRITQ